MGLRDLRSGGSETEEVTDEVVEAIDEDLHTVAGHLVDDRYPVETRHALHDAYKRLIKAGYELSGRQEFAWVPPKEDPSAQEMGESIRNIASSIVDAYPNSNPSMQDVNDLRAALVEMHDTLESAQDLDYAFKEIDVDSHHGQLVRSIGIRDDVEPDELDNDDGEEIFAGPRARYQLEQLPRKSSDVSGFDPPLFLGTDVRKEREATVPKETFYRHCAVLGVTGYGKSTFLTNNMKQLIEAGQGLCFIDPKGDDSERLAEIVPEDRKDDLIWIEPGSSSDLISGFNFINVGLPPGHPHIETAVSALVSDLKKMLGAGEYWGPRMDRIAQNLIRAMNVYNRQNPDEPDLNLADMYYVLMDPKSRHEFSVLVQSEGIDFVEDYTDVIAEMDDDNLEPILGRLQPWMEDPMARRMICFRGNGVNIPQAVEDGKIIVVRMGGQPDDLKQMLGMAVVRRIWATIRARAEQAEHNRDPFYLFVDEAHLVALADNTFPQMLAQARSYRLSINLSTQYLSQLPENVVKGIRVNCDTKASFNSGAIDEAKKIAPQLDIDPQTLVNESRFHIWTRMVDPETEELTDAFKVYIHPPFPPHRTTEEATELVNKSLTKWGREKLTPSERKDRLQFHKGDGQAEIGVGEEIVRMEQDPEIPPAAIEAVKQEAIRRRRDAKADDSEEGGDGDSEAASDGESGSSPSDAPFDPRQQRRQQAVLESVYAARVNAGLRPGEAVKLEMVSEEYENRTGESGYGTKLADDLEALSQYVELGTHDGDEGIRLTGDGRAEVFGSTGASVTSGLLAHRRILRETFEVFTRLGYQMELPTQSGAEEADGIGHTPFDPTNFQAGTKTAREIQETIQERMDHLEDEHPAVAALSDGRTVSIEAETTTQLKPAQMLTNFRKAVNQGHFAAFVTKDAFNSDDDRVPDDVDDTTAWWGRQIERNIYDREWNPDTEEQETQYGDENIILASRTDDDGYRTFYNQKNVEYSAGDDNEYTALRPKPDGQGRTTWRETVGGVVAEDPDNGVFAEFDSLQDVTDGNPAAVPAYYYHDHSEDEYVVREDGEKRTYGSKAEVFDEWETFKAPFIPQVEFDEMPTEEDFAIIVIPNAENPHHDQPLLYERGETTPLYDAFDIDIPDHALLTKETELEVATQSESDEEEDSEADVQEVSTDDVDGSEGAADGDETEESDVVDVEPESAESDRPTPSRDDSSDSGVRYTFPAVRSANDLPDGCPGCGGALTRTDSQYAGPATGLDNFPAACETLSAEGVLDLSTKPPMVTPAIEATIVSCESCSFVATVHFLEDVDGSGDSSATGAPSTGGGESDESGASSGPSHSPTPSPPEPSDNAEASSESEESVEATAAADVQDDESEDLDEELPGLDIDDDEENQYFEDVDDWDHRDND